MLTINGQLEFRPPFAIGTVAPDLTYYLQREYVTDTYLVVVRRGEQITEVLCYSLADYANDDDPRAAAVAAAMQEVRSRHGLLEVSFTYPQ